MMWKTKPARAGGNRFSLFSPPRKPKTKFPKPKSQNPKSQNPKIKNQKISERERERLFCFFPPWMQKASFSKPPISFPPVLTPNASTASEGGRNTPSLCCSVCVCVCVCVCVATFTYSGACCLSLAIEGGGN